MAISYNSSLLNKKSSFFKKYIYLKRQPRCVQYPQSINADEHLE